MVTKLGKSESYMLFGASGMMEQNERVHIEKGTLIHAYGFGMAYQRYVVYDDDMHAVEICTGNPDEVDESDLGAYFGARVKVGEETRPHSKKFGIGFYYDEGDGVIPDEVIQKSLKRADNLERLAAEVEEREEKKAEDTRARLLREYSYLQRKDGGKKPHLAVGANIRMELKRAFHKIKFSVRYESFSGGDSYDVDWTDGPTAETVSDIVKKYQERHPDQYSMGDYWDRVPSIFNELYGGVGYVMTNRRISDDAIKSIMAEKGISEEEACEFARENDLTPEVEKIEPVKDGDYTVTDYSEKAFVVTGDTKAIKEQLKAIGGRFNARLSCGAGWVFPKAKKDAVCELLGM